MDVTIFEGGSVVTNVHYVGPTCLIYFSFLEKHAEGVTNATQIQRVLQYLDRWIIEGLIHVLEGICYRCNSQINK